MMVTLFGCFYCSCNRTLFLTLALALYLSFSLILVIIRLRIFVEYLYNYHFAFCKFGLNRLLLVHNKKKFFSLCILVVFSSRFVTDDNWRVPILPVELIFLTLFPLLSRTSSLEFTISLPLTNNLEKNWLLYRISKATTTTTIRKKKLSQSNRYLINE